MVAILALLSATHGAQIEGATPRPATLVPAVAATSKAAAELKARGSFASIPLYFELNRGQTDPSVRYLSHAGRYTLYLTDDATVISMIAGSIQKRPTIATTNPRTAHDSTRLIQSAVRIRMIGADPHATMTGLDPLSGRVNYLVGAQTTAAVEQVGHRRGRAAERASEPAARLAGLIERGADPIDGHETIILLFRTYAIMNIRKIP
jgi:hypothetical protein